MEFIKIGRNLSYNVTYDVGILVSFNKIMKFYNFLCFSNLLLLFSFIKLCTYFAKLIHQKNIFMNKNKL